MTMVPFGTALPANNQDLLASELRNQFNALHKGDLFPFRPRAQSSPDLTIAVGASLVEGFWLQTYQNTRVPLNYAGGNSPAVTAPSANPRINLLTIDSSGTLAWTVGAEAASPAAPNCPDGKIPICYIYCRVGMAHIHNFEDDDGTNGYIYRDVRPFFTVLRVPQCRNFLHNGEGGMQTRKAAYTLVKDVWGVGYSDRWWGMATGTLVSAGTLTYGAFPGLPWSGFKFAGVTLTGTGIIYFRQRMLASSAAAFLERQGSWQALVYHDVGSAINYTAKISKANGSNDWTTKTEIGNSGVISVPSGAATQFKFENLTMGDCVNGIEIEFKVECGAISTKNFYFTKLKGEPQEACSEYISEQHAVELMECGYLTEKSQQMGNTPWAAWSQSSSVNFEITHPTANFACFIPFKIRKDKLTPTVYTYDRVGNQGKISVRISGVWYDNQSYAGMSTAEQGFFLYHQIANSECTAFTWYAPEWL